MRFMRVLLCCCLCVTLNGCLRSTEPTPRLSLQARTQYLNQMQSWHVVSRVGIRDRQDGHNLSMDWVQNQQQYMIRFYSPLVSDQATVTGRPGHVQLNMSDGSHYISASAEQLVMQHLGWNLPFSHMVYWIKGQPAPDIRTTSIKYDRFNQLQYLQQANWHLEYTEYFTQGGMSLPAKLELSNGDLHIKIVIKRFERIDS